MQVYFDRCGNDIFLTFSELSLKFETAQELIHATFYYEADPQLFIEWHKVSKKWVEFFCSNLIKNTAIDGLDENSFYLISRIYMQCSGVGFFL